MNVRKREISYILEGRVRNQGPYCMADTKLLPTQFRGYFIGSSFIRLLGLWEERTQYRIHGDDKAVRKRCAEQFPLLGQLLYLESVPVCLAVLVRPLLLPPVVVTLEAFDNRVLICYYSAKAILSRWSIRRTRKKVIELLPDDLKKSKVSIKPYIPEEPKEKGKNTGRKH